MKFEGGLEIKKLDSVESIEAEIKMLQSKLEFYKELEKTKSPVKAYKDWMGHYPPTTPSVDNIDDIRWRAFQMGYNAAYEEKVSEWEPTPQTPEQVADGLKEAFREAVNQGVVSSVEKKPPTLYDICMDWWDRVFGDTNDTETCIDDLVNSISEWLPKEHGTNSYKWNECIKMIKSKLR